MPRTIDFRRHAKRDPDRDTLSAEGRAQAENVGRSLHATYDRIFVSPAGRAAETVAWFLRGSGQALPPHAVVEGLASPVEERWRAASKAAGSPRLDAIQEVDPELVSEESRRMAAVARELFGRLPEGAATALAVGHSPLIEATVYGLTSIISDPLAECEGVTVQELGDGSFWVAKAETGPIDQEAPEG